jgi:general secretion pathway protein D
MRKVAFLSLVFFIMIITGCSTFNQNYKLATEAAANKDWDKAIEYYEKAILEDPSNAAYRLALTRAKILASYTHVFMARKLAAEGKKEEALAEFQKALSYDPNNRAIMVEAQLLTAEKQEAPEPAEIKIEPPVKLQVDDKKLSLNFMHDRVMLRAIFQALGKHAKLNILFDEAFKDIPYSVDLTDRTFEQALSSLCMATKNFHRVIDEKTLIIVPDLPNKRIQYELNAVKTFYLSNIRAEDLQASLMQMLRTQFKAPSIMVDKNLNSITLRDAPAVLELAGKLIRLWDKPKGEVVIDLEIMEVSRQKLKKFGLELDQYIIGLGYSGGENPPSESGWFDLSQIDFSKKANFEITMPTAFLNFLESDSDTKIIAQPRLRGVEGEEMSYLVGDKIPIPRTSFTPFAAGGVPQQPLTSFDYEDVGIDIKITPRIHQEGEITLELEMNIKSVGGTGVADIPIISTREIKNVIRLKDGETNLLAGLLKDEERLSTSGIIGLKSIPVLGGLFSKTEKTVQQWDVLMTITPYIIRSIPLNEDDLKPLWINLETTSASSGGTAARPGLEPDMDPQARRRTTVQREAEQADASREQNRVHFSPANFEITEGREFRVSVVVQSAEEISNMTLNLSFNPQVLELKQVVQGSIAARLGENVPFLQNIDNASGTCTIGFSSTDVARGFRGSGRVATLVFQPVAKGDSPMSFTSITANGPKGQSIQLQPAEGRVRVR